MLDDRDYMRRAPRFELQWSVTMLIVALNVLVFVVQNLVDYLSDFHTYDTFALSVDGLKHGRVWQLITFQFLHLPLEQGGVFHLLGNLFVILYFGPAVEQRIGRLDFIKVYLLSGTLGGLLQTIGGCFSPQHFGVGVVGASAGAFGTLAAFATFLPGRLLHFFFLPFGIRADVLFTVAAVVTLAGLFLPSAHMAHFAHLGGILFGFGFARRFARTHDAVAVFAAGAGNSFKITPAPR